MLLASKGQKKELHADLRAIFDAPDLVGAGKRTRAALIFPNEAPALRLITALAIEQGEEWGTGRTSWA